MKKEKSFLYKLAGGIDIWLLASLFALVTIGSLSVYSASYNYGVSAKYISVQLFAFGLGLAFMFLLANVNYQYYRQFDKQIYIISILLLVSVLIFGTTVNAAKRWINFGFASFQPVEAAKILYILVIASFLDKHWKSIKKPSILIYTFLLLIGHFILIMMQPAFSSTLSYFLVTLVLLYAAGTEPFYLLCIGIFGGLSVGVPLFIEFLRLQPFVSEYGSLTGMFINSLQASVMGIFYVAVAVIAIIFFVWWFLWKLRIRISIIYPALLAFAVLFGSLAAMSVEKSMKDYQRKRMVVFLYPETDPRGTGYNVIQSKIAMGSGKFLGKGFLRGTQTQLGFLPEQHTDFVFSVIGEEGGWVFSQLTIILYLIFIWRAFVISREARDKYGSYVALGIAAMFTFYAVINISMVTGMMPVAGIPLLFISYGGSSMLSSVCAVGILTSIHARRHTYY